MICRKCGLPGEFHRHRRVCKICRGQHYNSQPDRYIERMRAARTKIYADPVLHAEYLFKRKLRRCLR